MALPSEVDDWPPEDQAGLLRHLLYQPELNAGTVRPSDRGPADGHVDSTDHNRPEPERHRRTRLRHEDDSADPRLPR